MEMMKSLANIIQNESPWVIKLLIVFAAVLIFHTGFKYLFKRLQARFEHSKNHWKQSFTESIRVPVLTLVWLIALTLVVAIITQRIHPECPNGTFNSVFGLIILFCVTWFLLRWMGKMKVFLLKEQQIHGHHLDKAKIDVLIKISYLAVWVLALILALDILGFNIATLVTIGGISGLSIGIASKDVISNFFGGLMLYLTRPFHVGDYITAEKNIEGAVEQISWYYTIIKGNDRQPNYIPNSLFSTMVVVNRTRRSHWTIEEQIGIRYQDFKVLEDIINEIKNFFYTHPSFDKELPIRVYFHHFAESSLIISILASTTDTDSDKVAEIKHNTLMHIAKIIEAHGASLAYPTSVIDIPAGIVIHNS